MALKPDKKIVVGVFGRQLGGDRQRKRVCDGCHELRLGSYFGLGRERNRGPYPFLKDALFGLYAGEERGWCGRCMGGVLIVIGEKCMSPLGDLLSPGKFGSGEVKSKK